MHECDRGSREGLLELNFNVKNLHSLKYTAAIMVFFVSGRSHDALCFLCCEFLWHNVLMLLAICFQPLQV